MTKEKIHRMTGHLADWRVAKKGSWCIEASPFFLCIVLFQPFPVYRVHQGSPFFLSEVVISAVVGVPDDEGPLPFWIKFGGTWDVLPYMIY